jgi:hypothetical protein
MTNKIYRTAKGKPVDVGALRLQNEQVRAVGNMGVNARGDRIDAMGQVIDPVNQQIQRRIQKQTNVSNTPIHTSTRARDAEIKAQQEAEAAAAAQAQREADRLAALEDEPDGPMDEPLSTPVVEAAPVAEPEPIVYIQPEPAAVAVPQPVVEVVKAPPAPPPIPTSGLAAAIARAKTVKQELEKSPKQLAQEQGIKKI